MKPTVREASNFDAKVDANSLYEAFKGSGTNESSIIGILGHRSNAQRIEIARQYKQTFGQVIRNANMESINMEYGIYNIDNVIIYRYFRYETSRYNFIIQWRAPN
jgi:hypothetical protein